MREIEDNKRTSVTRLFFEGKSYDQIAIEVGISKGSVVNIIEAFREGVLPVPELITRYVDELRHLVVDLKKQGVTVKQLQSYSRLYQKLHNMGASNEKAERWLDICRGIASNKSEGTKFVEAALELDRIMTKTGLSYEAVMDNYEGKLSKLNGLDNEAKRKREELKNLEKKNNEKIKQAESTLDSITKSIIAAQDSYTRRKGELESELDTYLAQRQLSWKKVRIVESILNGTLAETGLTHEDIEKLRNRINEVGSLVAFVKELEQRIAGLKSNVSQLTTLQQSYLEDIHQMQDSFKKIEELIELDLKKREEITTEISDQEKRLETLSQEILDRKECFYMSQLVVDFLSNPTKVTDDDLSALIKMLKEVKQKRSGQWDEVVKINRLVGTYINPDTNNINVNDVRKELAHLILPFVKDKFMIRDHLKMLRAGYEVIEEGDKVQYIPHAPKEKSPVKAHIIQL